MYVKYATFNNVGPWRHLEQEFKRGLVGIFGPNGSGKSTMVNLIYAGLTNDFSRFPGVKIDCICDLAGPKEQSFLEIQAEHNGMDYWIRRSLRPQKPASALKIQGEKEITNSNDIEARLRHDLGVDMNLISAYCFIDQWKMFDFLEMTPSVRAEAFKYLCRTQKADRIYKLCDTVLTGYTPDAELVDNSDELAARLGEADLQLEKLVQQQATWQQHCLNEKSKATAEKLVRQYERCQELKTELPQVQQKLAKRQRLAKKAQRKAAVARELLTVTKDWIRSCTPPAQSAQTALQSWETYEKRKKRKDKLNEDLAKIVLEPLSHVEPAKPAEYDSKGRFADFLASARTDRKRATDVINVFEASHSGKCPTCNQVIDEKQIAKLRQDVARCTSVIKDLMPKLEAFETYEEKLKSWDKWQAGYEARKKAVTDELNTLRDLQEPEGDKAELTEAVATLAKWQAELSNNQDELATAATALTTRTTRVEETQKRINEMEKRIRKYHVDPAVAERARTRLAEHHAAALEIATLQGQRDEIVKQRQLDSTALERLRETLKRQKKTRRVLKTLGEARDVFHWSRLPNRVAQGNLVLMEDDVNRTLDWMGDPFFVEAQEGLTFLATKHGHLARKAEWLSGGEKGLLAIAFRYGADALFRTDIGTMWMDEPTAALAEENVEFFRLALEKMAAEVRGKRQLCVITHAAQLKTAFDQVIEVVA